MKKVKSKLLRISLMVLLIIAISFTGTFANAKTKTKRYMFGAVPSRSSFFIFATAVAHAINEHSSNIEVTVVETGATHDNLARLRKGAIDFGIGMRDGQIMAFQGIGRDQYIKHGPSKELRQFAGFGVHVFYNIIVDEGPYAKIKKLKDLNGVRFSAGIKGSGAETNTRIIFDALGIKPKWVYGGFGDVVAMAKDLEIAGFNKSAAGAKLDASMLDLKSVRKIKIIGYTDEELRIALKAVLGLVRYDVKQGQIAGLPNNPAFSSWASSVGIFASTAIPQDIGYQIVKAYGDNWVEITKAFPSAGIWTIGKDDITIGAMISEVTELPPLHAGTVQYFEGLGYKVPAKLIPPEYVRVK